MHDPCLWGKGDGHAAHLASQVPSLVVTTGQRSAAALLPATAAWSLGWL